MKERMNRQERVEKIVEAIEAASFFSELSEAFEIMAQKSNLPQVKERWLKLSKTAYTCEYTMKKDHTVSGS